VVAADRLAASHHRILLLTPGPHKQREVPAPDGPEGASGDLARPLGGQPTAFFRAIALRPLARPACPFMARLSYS